MWTYNYTRRMGSKTQKGLRKINNRPLLGYQIERVKLAKNMII